MHSNNNPVKPFEYPDGESYVLQAEDFGAKQGIKLTLTDPRDLDLLDKDRIHAVLLPPEAVSMLRRWLATNTLYLPKTRN